MPGLWFVWNILSRERKNISNLYKQNELELLILQTTKILISTFVYMKHEKILLILSFCICSTAIFSQSAGPDKFFLGLDLGTSMATNPTIKSQWIIRHAAGSGYYDFGNYFDGGLSSNMSVASVGIIPRYQFSKFPVSISSGLRYMHVSSYIRQGDPESNDFFYLQGNQDGSNSEYYRVKGVKQGNDYLGIPVEISVSPIKTKYFSLFLKGGAELGRMLATTTDVNFQNAAMAPYQQDVMAKAGSLDWWSTRFYSSLGARWGNDEHIKYSFEIDLPYVFQTSSSTLVDPGLLSGCHFTIEIPLK